MNLGYFVWISGGSEGIDSSLWAPNNPNLDIGNCVIMDIVGGNKPGKLYSANCVYQRYYICEAEY